jgi:hypothetical protein
LSYAATGINFARLDVEARFSRNGLVSHGGDFVYSDLVFGDPWMRNTF